MLPAEALRLGTPEISTLNMGTGSTEVGKMVFETAILSIMEFYGVEWSRVQIADLTDMIYSEYYWLHLAELKLFALKAKKGQYNIKEWVKIKADNDKGHDLIEWDGKIYGNLKPMNLLKWIERYGGESLYERGNIRIEQKALPASTKDDKDLVDAMPFLKEFAENLKAKGYGKDDDKELQEIMRQERIKMMQLNAEREQQSPEP